MSTLTINGGFPSATMRIIGTKKGQADADEEIPADVISKDFIAGQSQWIRGPAINQWASTPPPVLQELNSLYHQWRTQRPGPFYPFSDGLWLESAKILKEAGLPWLNVNLNLPDEVDTSWPINLKEFERQAVAFKGLRVNDEQASGYVCNWDEANQYAIRALQHELRRQVPDHEPLLVAARIESSIVQSVSQLFGMELLRINEDWESARNEITQRTGGQRPIIFAATLGNSKGQVDNFKEINKLLTTCTGLLHVDAARNFDYITTLSASETQELGIPKLTLRHSNVGSVVLENNTIYAGTIVAGGMNFMDPPPVVVLKPRTLGLSSLPFIEYIRGVDSTLAGSRDTLGPLLIYLQELRFGHLGIQDIYRRCTTNRRILYEILVQNQIAVDIPPASLDLVIHVQSSNLLSTSIVKRLGMLPLDDGAYLITIQPSVTADDIQDLVHLLTNKQETLLGFLSPIERSQYPVPGHVTLKLQRAVAKWRIAARTSAGYPFNHATYSALGPVIGHFLTVSISTDWAEIHAAEILAERKRTLGLPDIEHEAFIGSFTTGSTMGNRVGLHAAISQYPDGFIYYSKATHYSVKKIIRDNDILISRWCKDKISRFAEIEVDEFGRMIPEALTKQVLSDKALCQSCGKRHQVILFANLGTTFIGGVDDILTLRQKLRSIGSDTAYIHVDGALDLAFSTEKIRLGPPEALTKHGLPVVQGITMSHHKAWGIMVSGEVISYSPVYRKLPTVVSRIDPRAVFETWLFHQLYSPSDLLKLREYCLENSQLLRKLLHTSGIRTLYNEDSVITLFERQPPWLNEEFHLSPEGDWVHYLTMPHISPSIINSFVNSITLINAHFTTTFNYIQPLLKLALGQELKLVRIHSHDTMLLSRVVNLEKNASKEDGTLKALDFSLNSFKRSYIYDAMSFAAVDKNGRVLVGFLADTTVYRSVQPGRILVPPEVECDMQTLQHIASIAFTSLLVLLNLSRGEHSL